MYEDRLNLGTRLKNVGSFIPGNRTTAALGRRLAEHQSLFESSGLLNQ
jgi:hypothetical protein